MEDEPQRLESSLTAVRAVRGVVQAVWALASAQLPRTREAVAEAGVYLSWIERVVDRVAGPPWEEEGDRLTVVLGPERGFSGALAQRLLSRAPPGRLGLSGQRLAEVAARVAPEREADIVFAIPGPAGVDELPRATRELASAVLDHGKEVRVDILPPSQASVVLLARRRRRMERDFDLYSPPEDVLREALYASVVSRVRLALAQSLHEETRARAAATERALKAIEERGEALADELRIARMEEVTSELGELFAGFDAGARRA